MIWFKGKGFSTQEFYTYGIARFVKENLLKEDGEFWNDNDEIAVLEVFAWATLPEPYKESK